MNSESEDYIQNRLTALREKQSTFDSMVPQEQYAYCIALSSVLMLTGEVKEGCMWLITASSEGEPKQRFPANPITV